MPHVEFIWFARPLEKIHEHGLIPEEVEQAVRDAPALAIAQSRRSDHMTLRWATRSGREIRVVFDWADEHQTTVVPVTAFDVE